MSPVQVKAERAARANSFKTGEPAPMHADLLAD
jgi:hypothetical protein